MNDDLTAEQIQKNYDASLDSVNLLNAGKPAELTDDEWTDCVARNVGHLEIMNTEFSAFLFLHLIA